MFGRETHPGIPAQFRWNNAGDSRHIKVDPCVNLKGGTFSPGDVRMRRRLGVLTVAVIAVLACSKGATAPIVTKAPKPDPYITIRVRDNLDTTTAAGRAAWRIYLFLSGPLVGSNGISGKGSINLTDVRLGHTQSCWRVAADSIGQRLVAPFALGDTSHATQQPDVVYDSIAARWYAGDHTPPVGFVVLTITPTDAWNSVQYANGHGLVQSDPIKWAWDWTGSGIATFTERAATDTAGCNTY